MSNLTLSAPRVVTAKGGAIRVDEHIRSIVCYYSTGRLLVSKDHVFDPHVKGFVGRLQRQSLPVHVEMVSLLEIQKAYEDHEALFPEDAEGCIESEEVDIEALSQRRKDVRVDEAIRDFACFDNGTLLVSNDHCFNPLVRAFETHLRRHGLLVSVKHVAHTEIHRANTCCDNDSMKAACNE